MGTNQVVIGLAGSQWTTGAKARTEKRLAFYITGVSWGEGNTVKTFTFSADRAKAITLRLKTAKALASYLRRCGKFAFITQ